MLPSTPPPLPGVVHTDVRVRNCRWHVATAGDRDAPSILLLHGWPQHWWAWRKVIGPLARDHRVYAPDLRGFGWSDAPPGRYDKANLAADVELLLDELEVDACTVAGHDWGGFVAFLLALRAPERVERLAAFSIIHPWFDVPPPSPGALLTSSYQFVLATPVLGEQLQRRAPALVRALLARGGLREDVDLYTGAYERAEHARAASALYRTFLLRELPALARDCYANRTLPMPAIHATGSRDPVVTPERLEGSSAHAPQLRTRVVEGAGHWLPEERPQEVVELIREA
jgi:pimeloyl-ACP methyl ester carboxylesterase